MDWIDLAQNREPWRALVNTVLNLRVPYYAGKFLNGCTIGISSRRTRLRERGSEWRCNNSEETIYGSTDFVDLGRYFSFLICTQSVGLLGRGISSSQGCYIHTQHRINAHRHPCLELDSNPRSHVPAGEDGSCLTPRGYCDQQWRF
jgi:hypothetical protein